MRSLSVVLRDVPPDAELHNLVGGVLSTWKEKLGLSFIDEGLLTDEPALKIEAWTDKEDPMVEIDLVRDDNAQCRYLSALAPDQVLRRRMWIQLSNDFDVVPFSTLQDQVREMGNADPASYLRLALGSSGEFDQESYALISDGLRSPHVPVRAQAALAAALLHWSDFAGDAEHALASETDEGVARLLLATIQLCREGRLS